MNLNKQSVKARLPLLSRYHRPARRLGRAANYLPESSAQIELIKNSLLREYGSDLLGSNRVLSAAINEAEALAWQTAYPHLLFPVLAQEKAAVAQAWAQKQRQIRQGSLITAFSA